MPAESSLNQDLLWNAISKRDGSMEGHFFFGVITTGVYCRPTCPGRLPLRRNVVFFKDILSAERAGLRPCRRCHPNEPPAAVQKTERIRELAEYIREHAGEPLSLSHLAARSGLSTFYLQRNFKASIGVTPRQFVEACRLERLRNQLRSDASVTDAIYEAGFGSSSRVYEKADTHLGMTPAQYRAGGKDVVISFASADSTLGRMMIGATDRGICFVQFADTHDDLLRMLTAEYPAARLQPMPADSDSNFRCWMAELQKHLAGENPEPNLPLDLRASAFQMKVWRYLQSIPYGSVKSYSEVATGIGQPNASRAVARACAANKVALLIPCHRVIRGSRELAGYKWGLHRKRLLINLEHSRAPLSM